MPFSQSKVTYKISFATNYKYLEAFDELELPSGLSTSCYEIESKTVEAMPEDIWNYEVYLTEKPDLANLMAQIQEFVQNNNLQILSDVKLEQVIDQDWVSAYQNNLKPLEIERFFISARSHKELCPAGKIGLFIDAARAFGTGEHSTTSGCIEGLESLASSALIFDNIIDIGTGTGILSFAAKHLWRDAKIYGCDIESVAIEIAKDNAVFNNLDITFFQNSPEEIWSEKQSAPSFDLIISNILAGPLIELSTQIDALAARSSYAILSGFLDSQHQDVLSAFSRYGFAQHQVITKGNWVILIIKRG